MKNIKVDKKLKENISGIIEYDEYEMKLLEKKHNFHGVEGIYYIFKKYLQLKGDRGCLISLLEFLNDDAYCDELLIKKE